MLSQTFRTQHLDLNTASLFYLFMLLLQVELVNCYHDDHRLLSLRDPLTMNWPDHLWESLMDIGRKCTAQLKRNRPPMSSVSVICLL